MRKWSKKYVRADILRSKLLIGRTRVPTNAQMVKST
jgi:hypothetical protein